MESEQVTLDQLNQLATLSTSQPDNFLYTYILPLFLCALLLCILQVIQQSFAAKVKTPTDSQTVREINQTDFTLQDFLQANPRPTIKSIYLNNQVNSLSFFEDRYIPSFLHLHGNQITHLKVHHFSTCLYLPELLFYTNLSNLEHLDIHFIDASKRNCMQTYSTGRNRRKIVLPRQKPPFPQNFKRLKTLKLNAIVGSNPYDAGYARDFIEYCENLEYLKHPFYRSSVSLATPEHRGGPFGCVINYIEKRHEKHPDLRNLQYYDLEHVDPSEEAENISCDFCILVKCCYDHGVKLVNVHSDLLEMVTAVFEDNPEVFTTPLIYLRNVTGHTFSYELPNLEKLVIESTRLSSYGDTWTWSDEKEGNPPPQWPSLRILEVTIDSYDLFGDEEFPEESTEELLDFLFGMVKRERLRELKIRFGDELYDCFEEQLPVPRVGNITRSCPFVSKLSLVNWLGESEEMKGFWEGLPFLEEVELEECGKLCLLAFVDMRNGICGKSAFFKLKKLRKLSLKGLHLMPNICDLSFKLVFRHLKVKEFCMSSDVPLTSITVAGIESLLHGEFYRSVEKFSFDTWSLDGVSKNEFKQLKMKFRL